MGGGGSWLIPARLAANTFNMYHMISYDSRFLSHVIGAVFACVAAVSSGLGLQVARHGSCFF